MDDNISIYNDEAVKITFICTAYQRKKLHAYTKVRRISVSQLFRLFIDEMRISQMDEPVRYKIAESAFKIGNLLGGQATTDEPIKECIHDEQTGQKRMMWFSKKVTF